MIFSVAVGFQHNHTAMKYQSVVRNYDGAWKPIGEIMADAPAEMNLQVAHTIDSYRPGDVIPKAALPNNGKDHLRLGAVRETAHPVTVKFVAKVVTPATLPDELVAENQRLVAKHNEMTAECTEYEKFITDQAKTIAELEKSLSDLDALHAEQMARKSEEILSLEKHVNSAR